MQIKRQSSKLKIHLSKRKHKYFSISHSESKLIAMSSDVPCGIDIEKIKNRSSLLVDYILDPKEKNLLLKNFSDQLELLYAGWTIKEACFKTFPNGLKPSNYKIRSVRNKVCNVKSSTVNYSVLTEKISFDYLVSLAFIN